MKRLVAVIGAPVAHSLSPAMHNPALAAAEIDAEMVAVHVEPEDLAAAIAGMQALGFIGASVTLPHKQAVVELCHRVESPAGEIGAVNCICFEDGAIVGHNTDAGGFVDAITIGLGRDIAGCRVVLLGSGGAARAVFAGLRGGGAEVLVVARSPARAGWAGQKVRPWTAVALAAAMGAGDLVVDCTSSALADRERDPPAPVPLEMLPATATVASLIYHREPALLTRARARNLQVLDGLSMLLYQGARAFQLWTGQAPPVAVMRRGLVDELARRNQEAEKG